VPWISDPDFIPPVRNRFPIRRHNRAEQERFRARLNGIRVLARMPYSAGERKMCRVLDITATWQ
jgi:hypothetical protein